MINKSSILKTANLTGLILFLAVSDVYATDYYISNSTGSNLNPGTSASAPLKNVSLWTSPASPIAGNKLKAGDRVFFKRGDEWVAIEAQWDITSSGAAGNPITFDAYGTGPNPLFTGARTAAVIGNGANTWTQYAAGSNIWYNVAGSVNWYCRGVIEDGSKPLWRAGSLSAVKQGTFYSDGSKLYVWTTNGARPDTHTLYIAKHPTDDAYRGLIKVGKGGGSSYIIFKNLDARMSNSQGFTSSGEYQEFWNCNASFNARDGFYFIKYYVSAPGAQYNRLINSSATSNVIGGTGYGQGITVETPYTWIINTVSNNNGMAGIDFLDWTATTDVHHSGAYNCTTLNNGLSTTTVNNYDPGIYVDGGRDILIYGCQIGNNGMATDKVKLYPDAGVLIDVESAGYTSGKRPTNINIVNTVSYGNRGEALRIGSGGTSPAAVSNVRVFNSYFQRAISNANSDAETSGLGYYARTVRIASNGTIFKNNLVHTTVSSRSSLFLTLEGENSLDADNNVYYNALSSNVAEVYQTGSYSLSAWQTRKHDLHSATSSPLVPTDAATFINNAIQKLPARDAANPPSINDLVNLLNLYGGTTTPSADTSAPTDPANLTTTASGTQLTLSWTASSDNIGVTGYEIRSGSSLIGTTASTTFSFNGTVASTYTFTVKAYDAAGNYSGASNTVSFTIADTIAPTSPSSLTISNLTTSTTTQIHLVWSTATDNVGVAGYQVLNGTTLLGTTTATSYTFDGTAGTSYAFTVKAFDMANNLSSPSNAVAVTLPAATDTTPPSVPAGLLGSLIGQEINLSWSKATDNVGVAGYQIFNGAQLLGTSTVTNFLVSPASPGGIYSFTVTAYDAAGNYSAPSLTEVFTVPDITAPSNPANLTGSFSGTQVSMAWTASTDDIAVQGYQILNGSIVLATSTTTSYAFNGATGTSYALSVKAYDAANNLSGSSNTVAISIPSGTDTASPSNPANLTCTLSGTKISMAWAASTDNVAVAGYQILNGSAVLATTTATNYTVSGSVDTTYNLSVIAYDAANNFSGSSNTVTIYIPVSKNAPTAPTNLTAVLNSSNKVYLSWTGSTGGVYGVHGYNIFRNDVYLNTVGGTSFTDQTVVNGNTYSYKVRAYDASNNKSAWSNIAVIGVGVASTSPTPITSPEPAPSPSPSSSPTPSLTISSFSVSSTTSSTAIIDWQTNIPSTGYVKYGLVPSQLDRTSYTSSSGTMGSIILSGLSNFTDYYYQVVVTDGSQTITSPVSQFKTKNGK